MEKCLLVVFALIESIICEILCRADYTFFNHTTLEWSSNTTLTISNPPCLDQNSRYVVRQCENGVWSNFTCHSLSPPTPCPKGQMFFQDKCLLISPQQAFDAPCPDQSEKFFNYSKLNTQDDFWLPFKKINNTFIYTSANKRYSTKINMDAFNFTHDCLISSKSQAISIDCKNLKYHLCAYNIDNFRTLQIRHLNRSKNRINLELKEKNGTMYLKIYSPENLGNFLFNDYKSIDSEESEEEEDEEDSEEEDEGSIYDGDRYEDDFEDLFEDDARAVCFTNAKESKSFRTIKINEVFNTLKNPTSSHPSNLLVYSFKPLKYPGEYWCEAYDLNETKYKSNVFVHHGKLKGNEFSLKLLFKNSDEKVFKSIKTIRKHLRKLNFPRIFQRVKFEMRVMQIVREKKEVILHLSTKRKKNLVDEFEQLKNNLKDNLPSELKVLSFRNSEFCTPETNGDFRWDLTALESTFVSKKLCLDSQNLPVIRKCLGNFLEGAFWSNITLEHCNEKAIVNKVTEELYKIVTSSFFGNVTEAIKNLTINSNNLTPLDFYFVASTLYNVSSQYEDKSAVYDLIETIDNILEANHDTLKDSQTFLNATDTILNSIDNFLEGRYLLNNLQHDFLYRRSKFLVYITKPFVSNVSGIAVYSNDNEVFDEDEVVKMKLNETFDDLKVENLDLSVYVPLDLLNSLIEDGADKDNLTVITTVFYNDKLFNSVDENNATTYGRVISVTIPNHGIFLKKPIPLIFKNRDAMGNTECAYWDYGRHSPNKTGRWSFNGGSYLGLKNDLFSECAYTHLTHFALLIMSQKFIKEDNDIPMLEDIGDIEEHDLILQIITIVGCALSLIGLTGIFLTAFIFKKWRQKAGTKILLQLSVTILFEIIFVNFADLPNQTWGCNIVGICLHYVVLSKFSWMFVSAILQYVRFVKVFAVLPPRIVLKAMLFGWCIPLIPVVLVLGCSPDNYNLGAQKFCYPTGMGLYLGLFAPVVVIVGANLIVFTVVMKNVLESRVEGREQCKGIHKLQLYLGILLFFMLGIPWIFGILAEWLDHSFLQLIFVYLFCLTATLQGCILFIFYVILDKDTRNLWGTYLKKYKIYLL